MSPWRRSGGLLRWRRSRSAADPIRELAATEILVVLRKVEKSGHLKMAKRLRAVVGQMFRYAIATARADFDPAYGLGGAIAAPIVKHRAALVDADEFAHLVRAA